ncbi:MAG: hypothetical protein HUU54_05530 [Ignavibacteriaceae bacterium]|nr:hypothetical protein [Ignavibacteriaceae bacterium]
MKHLTDTEIENYFLNKLPASKTIKAGIHINECRECYSRAEYYNAAVSKIEADLEMLSELPIMVKKHQRSKFKKMSWADKNKIIRTIENYIDKSGEILKSKLDELLEKLIDPAYEITPFSYLIEEALKESPAVNNFKTGTSIKAKKDKVLQGKSLQIIKIGKSAVELRVKAKRNELPTLFSHTVKNGVEVVNFTKAEGINYFSALIPGKKADKHFVVHKK